MSIEISIANIVVTILVDCSMPEDGIYKSTDFKNYFNSEKNQLVIIQKLISVQN